MSCNCGFPSSSVGKKLVMALTGLLLFGFLVTHLAGNFLLFAGKEVYNNYSHTLISNPLIYVAEAGLLALFLLHIGNAIAVTLQNRRARPIAYVATQSLGKKSLASSTMIWSGVIILIFVFIHLKTFKFGADVAPLSPAGVRDLYSLVVTRFHDKLYSLFYILCMSALGFHLSHAIQSSVRTLGVGHPVYLVWIKRLSVALGVFFAIAYSIFPLYFGFFHGA